MVRRINRKIASISTDPPQLTDKEWNALGVVGLVFFLMAILQLSSFSDFRDWFEQLNFGQPTSWAVSIILAELWAAAGFFKLRLSPLFRLVSAALALMVSGFWFLQSMRLVSTDASSGIHNSGFFGRFLAQDPSLLTVLEASLLLFFVIYGLNLFKIYFEKHFS